MAQAHRFSNRHVVNQEEHNLADSVMVAISARANFWRDARWKDSKFKTCHCRATESYP